MSLQFKRNTPRDYSNLKVLFEDTSQTSPKFFRVSDVPQVLTKGKNLLRISAHPSNLVTNSQIIVDIKDANGDPIYFEVPDYLENDKSRVISIWIYHDKDDFNTANGDATITIYGISRVDQNGKPVPSRYRGKHNVKWSTTINVDRDRENISPVIFKGDTLPTISISESIEAYQNLPSTDRELELTTQTGGGARYIYKGRTPIVQLTDGSEFNQEMVEYSLQLGNFETPATPETRFENPTNITSYTSSVLRVLDSTTAILQTPFTTEFDDREDLTHTFTSIESADYSISYFQTSSNIVTENQRSYANLTISNVNPIVGYPNKLRVLIKSDGLPGDYELLNEVTVPFSSSLSVKIPIPSEHLEDPKRIKVQYLNSVGEISRTETITEPYNFEGGNYYFGGRKNLISGSMFISNTLDSGIELGGISSGFIRSVGFEGQTSASLGKGPGGFIIYSGSGNLQVGEDVLNGVGLQLIGDNDDRHLIFTTDNGGLLDVKTDKFFIGTTDTQFISGSDGNIEISSSIFHLDPQHNLLVIGADAVINADLTVNNLRTPALINGVQSTRANSSSSIDSDGFARFVSASIGGFEVSETQINSANDNLILKDSGQITGSNVLFSGGKVAGFEITNTQINSTNNNIILKASGQLTASDGFLFGNKGSEQYVQFDDGNLVVRGDLAVDQIFTPATIGGSPSNITNASSSITSDGFAKFVSASIGGWDISTGSIEGGNLIMKPEGILQTRDFATGVKGWKISSEGNGTAEFENVRIRGTMRTTTFEKESVNAVGGQLWVANSTTITGSVIANDATMSVKNAKGFESGEILIAKKVDGTGFQTEYILVNSSSVDGNQSNEDENYGRIYVTRGYGSGSSGDFVGDIASISQSYEDGQVVVSTGKVGTGYIKLNANPSDTATPFIDVVERTGSGLYDVSLAARLGDLSGLANSDYVFGNSTPGYGLATNNVFLQGGIKATFGEIGGFGINETTISSSNSLLILSSSGQIFAESGRIASFQITSSKFDALRTVEVFTPVNNLTASFGDGASIPTEVDNRATITITNVTESNISITERVDNTRVYLDTPSYSLNEPYQINYSGSFNFNSGQVTFVSESLNISFPTASFGAITGGFFQMDKPGSGEFTIFNDVTEGNYLESVNGLYAFAIEVPGGDAPSFQSIQNRSVSNTFFGGYYSPAGLSLDDRVGFWEVNGDDLELFVKPDLRMISSLTGSSTSTVVSSSNATGSLNNWDVVGDPARFILVDEWDVGSFVDGFSGVTNSQNPTEDFINAYWTASNPTEYSPNPQYIWISSGSIQDDREDGGSGLSGQILYTFFLTASKASAEIPPDTSLFAPQITATVYSGEEITPSQYNTISSSFFVYDEFIANQFGFDNEEQLLGYFLEGDGSFPSSSYAPVRGVSQGRVSWNENRYTGGNEPQTAVNYSNSYYHALYLQPGWFINPSVVSILNGIDTNTGNVDENYPNTWLEIGISGSTYIGVSGNSRTQPGHGVPLTLYNNFVRTQYTPSTEVKLYNSIWPLDIAESGSFQPNDGTEFGDNIILVIGSAVNITDRLDATRVQTDLTPSQLASLTGSGDPYADVVNDNTLQGPRYGHSVTYESTKQYSVGTVSTGFLSGSFVDKVTFRISGSGEVSSSNFFLDEFGNITGSQVNFSGGIISGSDLTINANQFEFKNNLGRVFGDSNNFIISSSLLSLDNNSLEVKGDLRASSGYIQDTYLGGKIVETGVRNPSVVGIRYSLPFLEVWTTSSTDNRLGVNGDDSSQTLVGSHGNWVIGGPIQTIKQYLVTGSALDGVSYPDEFKSWYDISGVSNDYKFIDNFNVLNVSDASASISPSIIGTQLVFNSASFKPTGSAVVSTVTSEFINISESLNNNYRNTHLQFAARGTTHPYSGGFTGFYPQYRVDIVSGSKTFFTKRYKDENATHERWKVFDIPITDILTIDANATTGSRVEKEFKVKVSMNYSGSSATGTLGSGVEGIGFALTEMRMVEPVRIASIDTQTIHFKDTYITWDGKEVTAHKGHFAPIITSSTFESISGSEYSLGRPSQRWRTAYLKNSVSTLSDRRLKSNIQISDLGLNFIDSLKPVKYNMGDEKTHYGLIAQEVSQSLAEFNVEKFGGYDTDGQYLALRYEEFISPLIKAVQEQSQIIMELQKRVETLESGSNN